MFTYQDKIQNTKYISINKIFPEKKSLKFCLFKKYKLVTDN